MSASAEVLAAIGDPIRFAVLRFLLADDGLAQAALADRLGVTPSRLGNHLATLRAAGLVEPIRAGRAVRYHLRSPDAVRALIAAVQALSGPTAASAREAAPGLGSASGLGAAEVAGGRSVGSTGAASAFARARTCYDHLAGEIGVQVLDRLVADGALTPGPEAESELRPGPALDAALERLGVPYPQVRRRKLAVGCLDATAGRPHLGGALGSEVLRSFLRRGLLLPGPAPRSLVEHPGLARVLA